MKRGSDSQTPEQPNTRTEYRHMIFIDGSIHFCTDYMHFSILTNYVIKFRRLTHVYADQCNTRHPKVKLPFIIDSHLVSSEYLPVASDADLVREVDMFVVLQPEKVFHTGVVDVHQLALVDDHTSSKETYREMYRERGKMGRW